MRDVPMMIITRNFCYGVSNVTNKQTTVNPKWFYIFGRGSKNYGILIPLKITEERAFQMN